MSDRVMELLRTSEVFVVFTSIDETLAAVRVGSHLARALSAPLTVVQFRTVPYAVEIDQPGGESPFETHALVHRLRSEGLNVRLRVYVCRSAQRAIPVAFKRRSLIVVGGRRSWWPTRSSRLSRALEAEGHLVMLVDEAQRAA